MGLEMGLERGNEIEIGKWKLQTGVVSGNGHWILK